MKTFAQQRGPFAQRPYYTAEEIERTCTIELAKVGLLAKEPSPTRIERFFEKRFGVSPTYDEVPDGVLGFSVFGRNGLERVVIARALVEDGTKSSQRRANTTLAHEAGHALFQAHLFVLGAPQAGLFGGQVTGPTILCRCESVQGTAEHKYDGKWWEYQANLAIGPLLMPRALVHKALADVLLPAGPLGMATLADERREQAAALLAETFEVNAAAARIRVKELYPADSRQLTL